jgi:hypothetical protein
VTRLYDEIVAVWQDGCDLVLLTRGGHKPRILAERMIGTLAETRAYVTEKLNRPVRLLLDGNACEFIFEL